MSEFVKTSLVTLGVYIAYVLSICYFIQLLWNEYMTYLFNLTFLSYPQTLCLYILIRLIIK